MKIKKKIRGLNSSKPLEQLYKLLLNRSFQKEVVTLRVKLSIPRDGFTNKVHKQSVPFYFRSTILLDAIELLKKYHLPISCRLELVHYLEFNLLEEMDGKTESVVAISYPNRNKTFGGMEKVLNGLSQAYVSLYILDASSKTDVFNEISKNWNKIQESIKAQMGNTHRLRIAPKKDRNLILRELNQKGRTELANMIHINSSHYEYKEMLVAEVAKKIYGYKEVTPEIVKKYNRKYQIF